MGKWLSLVACCAAIGATWDNRFDVASYFMLVAIFGQMLMRQESSAAGARNGN